MLAMHSAHAFTIFKPTLCPKIMGGCSRWGRQEDSHAAQRGTSQRVGERPRGEVNRRTRAIFGKLFIPFLLGEGYRRDRGLLLGELGVPRGTRRGYRVGPV